MSPFNGMRVAVSSHLTAITVPVREHKKRKGTAYHRRVQKKWTKRYGTQQKEVSYTFDPRSFGLMGEPMAVVSPRVFAMLSMLGKP